MRHRFNCCAKFIHVPGLVHYRRINKTGDAPRLDELSACDVNIANQWQENFSIYTGNKVWLDNGVQEWTGFDTGRVTFTCNLTTFRSDLFTDLKWKAVDRMTKNLIALHKAFPGAYVAVNTRMAYKKNRITAFSTFKLSGLSRKHENFDCICMLGDSRGYVSQVYRVKVLPCCPLGP